jgi:putative transposase
MTPNHIHLFVAGHYDFALDQWVRALKRTLSTVISARRPHWQSGFFRSSHSPDESYRQKWEYVVENPVRAGLVNHSDEWPWQGEIERIESIT